MIIGSGIVGLSTALSLRERYPKARIAVLERGIFPTGASTKNAGFACFGSLTELLEDIRSMGKEEALELVKLRLDGLEKLRSRLGDQTIDYQNHGGYELIREQELAALDQMEMVNHWLSPLFDDNVFELRNETVRKFGFNPKVIKGLVFNKYEGQVHTGKMMQALITLAQKSGINIFTGTEVISLKENDGVYVSIRLSGSNSMVLYTNKIAVCTNAFTKSLIPDIPLDPGRGMVLITKPIPGLKLKGTFHMDQGYYYFRNFEDRILFGGGRNLFQEEEQTTDFSINEKILDALGHQLDTVILPGINYEIDHIWTGIMAFGKNKAPIVKPYSDRIFIGVRLGGMGVAIGACLGEKLAALMSD